MTAGPLTFAGWVEKSGRSRADICGELKISAPYLSQIINRKRRVSLELGLKIGNMCGGVVPLESLVIEQPQNEAAE